MIDIKIQNGEARIKMKGSSSELLAEMSIIVKEYYGNMKAHDEAAALISEMEILEIITGEKFDPQMMEEYLDIQNTVSPEDTEKIKIKIHNHLMEEE